MSILLLCMCAFVLWISGWGQIDSGNYANELEVQKGTPRATEDSHAYLRLCWDDLASTRRYDDKKPR